MYFKLHIPEPCHEDWSLMTPASQGRFCASCKKEVVDFTELSRKQIADKVKNGEKICGRYRKDQLETTYFTPENKPFKNLGIAAAFTSLLALCEPAMGQETEVKTEQKDQYDGRNDHLFVSNKDVFTFNGTISEESDVPLPGVYVELINSGKTFQTDFDGNFTIKLSAEDFKKYNTIRCSYVGFEVQEFKLDKENLNRTFKLTMTEALMGEVIIIRNQNKQTKKPRSKYQ
ncbi:carboxypeptidase-like protein [Leeuwenhoekiella aestuarii]|uniref:Carboxypeptidase-like protein n=1 Tax=Leeuwenhoekiella aestuarii TaxID=2249426 RepID=A0A4V1KPN7_9FLAO|nr:carboxypeptidase-like regulatory domain-containing protein [Leeuwenhoekiella aestuarii]RXG16041.1 carboxypeptidase-like protein [Leeuwenhoekiella aestuarii]RXG16735.1 carboxypeptidase-like protein [Leeuwenhoekiella aestuarii]